MALLEPGMLTPREMMRYTPAGDWGGAASEDFLVQYEPNYIADVRLGDFTIRHMGPPPPFAETAAFGRFVKSHEGEPQVLSLASNWGIGEPVQTPFALQSRKDILVGKDQIIYPSDVSGVQSRLQEWISKTVVNHSSRYSKQGGNLETRDVLMREFGGNLFAGEQMTVLTGGEARALTRLTEFVFRASPEKKIIRIDARGTVEDLQKALDQLTLENQDEFIELIIDQESVANGLSQSNVDAIKALAQSGRMIIVNQLNNTVRHNSIARDPDLGRYVITMDTSPLAQITGVIGILGDQDVIKWIQDRYTALHGTPSTTEQDFRVYLSDLLQNPGWCAELRNLNTHQMPTLFLQNLARLLQLSIRYLTLDSDGQRKATTDYKRFVSKKHTQLERSLRGFYQKSFGEQDWVVINGGAREGLMKSFGYLRDRKGVKTVLVPTPDWPYKDITLPGLNIVFINDAYTREGIDEDRILKAMEIQTEPYAIVLNSGPHNPTGYVTSKEMKRRFIAAVSKNNGYLVDDASYLQETFKGNDESTYAQVADELGFKNYLNIAAATKDWGLPGIRLCAISSRMSDFAPAIKNNRKVSEEIHAFAMLYQLALAQKPEETRSIMDHIRNEAQERYNRFIEVLNDEGIFTHTKPQGGLFVCLPLPCLSTDEPMQQALDIARDTGVAFLPVLQALDGGDAWVDEESGVWARFALGGMRNYDWDIFDEKVRHTIEILRGRDSLSGRWPEVYTP